VAWNVVWWPLRRLQWVFRGIEDGRSQARIGRRFALLAAAVLAVAGCDPGLDRRYMDEGAGATLYTSDQARQVALLDDYFNFLCDQAHASCVDYVALVQAGMNDIDQRCDGYLTWLEARRRDKAPFLAELQAVQTATHTIMTITGSSPQSLDILTAAFGLASATYTQWNSRLLISLENSTVQEVVYNSLGDYRAYIKSWPIPDRSTAVYLLRNYLRMCMPITIEAKINTTTKLVQRGATSAARDNLVITNTQPTPTQVRGTRVNFTEDASVPILRKFFLNASADGKQFVFTFLSKMGLDRTDWPLFLRDAQYKAQRAELVNQLRSSNRL